MNYAGIPDASAAGRGLMTAAHYSKLDALMSEAALEAALATIPVTTADLPDSADKRYVTDAQSAALHPAVTLGALGSTPNANGASLAGQVLTLQPADATFGGFLSLIAQVITGVKTFANAIVAAAGIEISTASGLLHFTGAGASKIKVGNGANNWEMEATPGSGVWRFGNNAVTYLGLRYSDGYSVSSYGMESPIFAAPTASGSLDLHGRIGTGSTDVAVKIGTRLADGSVHGSAKILSLQTGLGSGSPVERAWFKKSGTDGFILGASLGSFTINSSVGLSIGWNALSIITIDSNNVTVIANVSAILKSNAADGAGAIAAISRSTNAWANATAKLHSFQNTTTEKSAIMANGEFEHAVAGAGVVLKSPDGTRWRITVDNAGVISAALA